MRASQVALVVKNPPANEGDIRGAGLICGLERCPGEGHGYSLHCSFLFIYLFIFISWRLITLQYCSGFCHTLKWISHGFTCVPHPDPPSHLPLHPIPLGLYMEFRKMLMITLYAKQKKRHRCIEQTFGLCGRRRGWDISREQHRNMYII